MFGQLHRENAAYVITKVSLQCGIGCYNLHGCQISSLHFDQCRVVSRLIGQGKLMERIYSVLVFLPIILYSCVTDSSQRI